MRQRRTRFVSILFLLIVCTAGIAGFVRGWFRVNTTEDSARNEVHIDVTLDRGRFQNDADSAAEKTRQEASRLSDSVRHRTSESTGGSHDASSAAPL
jgi:hypothetical protein